MNLPAAVAAPTEATGLAAADRTTTVRALTAAAAAMDRTVAAAPTAGIVQDLVVVAATVRVATAAAGHRNHPRDRVGPINPWRPL
jgi:hypothetical protein